MLPDILLTVYTRRYTELDNRVVVAPASTIPIPVGNGAGFQESLFLDHTTVHQMKLMVLLNLCKEGTVSQVLSYSSVV